jgi:hypothetical protein
MKNKTGLLVLMVLVFVGVTGFNSYLPVVLQGTLAAPTSTPTVVMTPTLILLPPLPTYAVTPGYVVSLRPQIVGFYAYWASDTAMRAEGYIQNTTDFTITDVKLCTHYYDIDFNRLAQICGAPIEKSVLAPGAISYFIVTNTNASKSMIRVGVLVQSWNEGVSK